MASPASQLRLQVCLEEAWHCLGQQQWLGTLASGRGEWVETETGAPSLVLGTWGEACLCSGQASPRRRVKNGPHCERAAAYLEALEGR